MGDSVVIWIVVWNDLDFVWMVDMKKELEEVCLSEVNMCMEMEQMRLKVFVVDFVKLVQ